MSAAHLHAVPDPDDVPDPAPAAVETPPGEGPVVVELLDTLPAPAEEAGDELEDQAADEGEPGEELEDADEDEEGDPGEEAPRRALAFPDLRPYVTADRETVRELGSLAVDVKRSTAPRVRRGLAPVFRAVWKALRAGTVVVLLVLRAWFSGEVAPKVPPLWRLILGPLVTVYVVCQTVALYPWSPLVLGAAWPLLAVIAQRWAAGQVDRAAKAKASGKGSGKGGKGTTEGAPKTFAARLAAALARPAAEPSPKEPAEASAEAPEESPAEPGEEAAEEPEETPVQEAPAPPSRDDLVRALHALVGTSSGTLHTALRDRLRYPSTRAVREALEAAGITSRPGVRAVGGNGAGVHRADFPPLPPPREGSPGSDVAAGQEPTTTPTTPEEEPGEGLAVGDSEPGPEYPFDVVRDHAGGPAAWKIIPRS
ncbi:hypothetical protein QEH48_gp100 [Streptomyces phage TurkishDelight]|uniref:Uncharacterized protein n=1 Tax=Streptomyces phage TurkishDelight TaxID=2793708 RepID=A0A7T0M141_9CAUD|nr:hypothetical protein QEH48_gp100 [Streptomyces phage TurkishDelight]QPL14129.1 hypothetical protein SEA_TURKISHDELIGHT_100 [Streptomyces phage TurkishDelight]